MKNLHKLRLIILLLAISAFVFLPIMLGHFYSNSEYAPIMETGWDYYSFGLDILVEITRGLMIFIVLPFIVLVFISVIIKEWIFEKKDAGKSS